MTGLSQSVGQMGLHDLLATWERVVSRLTLGEHGGAATSDAEPVSPLTAKALVDALAANARLVDMLISERALVAEAAKGRGASSSEIGSTLGINKHGPQRWY